jgi:hypothetical protein
MEFITCSSPDGDSSPDENHHLMGIIRDENSSPDEIHRLMNHHLMSPDKIIT